MSYRIPSIIFLLLLQLTALAQEAKITVIPTPQKVKKENGNFVFSRLTLIETDVKEVKTVKFLTDYLLANWKFKNEIVNSGQAPLKGRTLLVITEKGTGGLAAEGYKLSVTPAKITLRGRGAGLFYGIQTLIQLFPNEKKGTALIPCVTLEDEPRFGYRGLMLDVSRHFFTIQQLKDLLDLMASYKLNRFHWHLTDDQGWRIEIKSLPKLTSTGAWRVPRVGDFSNGIAPPKKGELATSGGYYTQVQIRDIVKYAADRHIAVLPEIDVPGHCMAAIAAYPELSVTKNPETKVNPGSSFAKWFPEGGFEMFEDNTLNPADEHVYQFLDQVFGEVAQLFPYEYIHVGGDECFKGFWAKDPGVQEFMKNNSIKDTHALQSYFIARVNKILQSKNKKLIGWDEILEGGLSENVAVMNRFGEEGAIKQTKKKMNVVLAPGKGGLYFDYAQSYSDMEPSSHGSFAPVWKAYDFNPEYNGLAAEDKKYILGLQGCLWTENVSSISKLQYMILPRLFALAETAWTSQKNKNYNHFAENALPAHLERLDKMGSNYRVPTAFDYTDTTMVGDAFLFKLKPPLPGAKIFYTVNNRMPGDADQEYTSPIALTVDPGKKRILKTVVITAGGRRSVVTRTTLYNPLKDK